MSMQDATRPQALACPKCNGEMRIQRFPENDAYRCEGCRGLRLPLLAHEQPAGRAAAIDTARYARASAPLP